MTYKADHALKLSRGQNKGGRRSKTKSPRLKDTAAHTTPPPKTGRVDGDWIVDPSKVKDEFLNHFAKRFAAPVSNCTSFDYTFPNRLYSDQNDDLERNVSYEEIKGAVWDCGTNKSPGPDGSFPSGCNSSFIALIPKSQEAKMVKDFCPISLIGSIYKIITKSLANHLSLVISELVSDVQSAFFANRQIFDGRSVLNELLSWCKYKKSKALIFKIDFEKAFDLIRWDYLDVVLSNFGFGSKWRSWIQGCLNSAMGSILVNGSPTTEFKFAKGLKQRDPLSPFLFIMIMESLHLSFNNIVNAGFYKCIKIIKSLSLSQLFYADDVIFVGKWKLSNLSTIVNVLKWFHCASGLKINLHKSKLMGVGIPNDVVASTAKSIGCSTLHLPFNYLGVKVGGIMSRLNSWDDVVSKLSSRLSKWKLKTLSIGGRLTLIKSVLSSLPLYYMSSLKVPKVHGACGAIDKPPSYSRRSHWLDIVNEFRKLSGKGVDLISLVKKKVGNGELTSFWHDPWIGDLPLKKTYPRLPPRIGIDEEHLLLLISNTSSVMLPNTSERWSGQLGSLGIFLVKSAREFINDSLLPKSVVPTRWVKCISVKINIFAWRVSLDKLPTSGSSAILQGCSVVGISISGPAFI
nr:RNA-directed DNA polymerase, eukaryota [Tanacetum cinerariifolium]